MVTTPQHSLADVLDLLTVISVEHPLTEVGKAIDRWRLALSTTPRTSRPTRAERDAWGTAPHEAAAQRRFFQAAT